MIQLSRSLTLFTIYLFAGLPILHAQTDPDHPNVILIIADDLGVDVANGFQQNALMPVTPVLDSLRTSGLTFKQAWAAPKCSPTRAAMMSGKYGYFTGVLGTPGNLDTTEVSLFEQLSIHTNDLYSNAVIGKWHISAPQDFEHPAQLKVQHYEGSFDAGVTDYYNWTKVNDGIVTTETEYATAHFTNSAISWVSDQTQPFFLWLAHVAPHSPFHEPPAGTYSVSPIGSDRRKYIAMIESMDYEIGRLLNSIPANVRDNTVIMFIGDNGTPGNVIQNFASDHAKSTLYQGGVHVPMFVSGKGVTRVNEAEDALIQATDIFATVLELTGPDLPNGIYENSISFKPMLSTAGIPSRPWCYTELESPTITGWAIRDDRYKLIMIEGGSQEFYDLQNDSLELNNLINSLSPSELTIKNELDNQVTNIHVGIQSTDFPVESDLQIRVGPNPSKDLFHLQFTAITGRSYSIAVYDESGKLVKPSSSQSTGAASDIHTEIDLGDHPDGLYLISVTVGETTESIRVVKRNR